MMTPTRAPIQRVLLIIVFIWIVDIVDPARAKRHGIELTAKLQRKLRLSDTGSGEKVA
jgi:hypothetical protein